MVSPAAVVPVKIIAFLQRRFCETAFFFDHSMPRGRLAPPVYKSNCGIVGTLRPSAASTPNPASRAAAGIVDQMLIIAPSPLAGEGNSAARQRRGWVRGCLQGKSPLIRRAIRATPSPARGEGKKVLLKSR